MLALAKQLFPFNRSILGPDIRLSFKYFTSIERDWEQLEFKSGERVFDWIIPQEWKIHDAYLEHESGARYAEFKINNLHVVGYSTPTDLVLNKQELSEKIYTHPDIRDAVPYVTTYYKEDWGFCMSSNDLENMPEGKYKVLIDSELSQGMLVLQELKVKGELQQEIFFSSYLCHPSMANNELSGPVLLSKLAEYVKQISNLKFSYRFVLLPETIGSIAYISRRKEILKRNVICGFNLSCVGDERAFSHVASRAGNTVADLALKAALEEMENVNYYSFLDRGSDERQYCAPGIDLPLCTFCKSKFGEYPEYHSDKDNFNVVTSLGLAESFQVMKTIIDCFEIGIYPQVDVLCEPQLGIRGLYPLTSQLYKGQHPAKLRMDIISHCDGRTTIFDIANSLSTNLAKVLEEIRLLAENNLIKMHSSSQ